MPRTPTNWKNLYKETKERIDTSQEIISKSLKTFEDLDNKYKHLSKEFDKAVEINKQFQNTIMEQRGIIHYLELQVRKLDSKLTELENK